MRQDDDALPPHKREGWAERMYERADLLRKEKKENELLDSKRHKAAIEWAISTGAKS